MKKIIIACSIFCAVFATIVFVIVYLPNKLWNDKSVQGDCYTKRFLGKIWVYGKQKYKGFTITIIRNKTRHITRCKSNTLMIFETIIVAKNWVLFFFILLFFQKGFTNKTIICVFLPRLCIFSRKNYD